MQNMNGANQKTHFGCTVIFQEPNNKIIMVLIDETLETLLKPYLACLEWKEQKPVLSGKP